MHPAAKTTVVCRARLVGQGLGKIADSARAEVEAGITEFTKLCFIQQEKQVMTLHAKVIQCVEDANAEVEKNVSSIPGI